MVDSALVIHPDGKVEEHVMRVAVTGVTFTLHDDANTVMGTGMLSGPAWHWKCFKAKYISNTTRQSLKFEAQFFGGGSGNDDRFSATAV